MATPITIELTDAALISLVTGIGGWFARVFFARKSKCEGCPYHADHERRLRELETSTRELETSTAAIRASIPSMQQDISQIRGMVSELLLRLTGGTPPHSP